MSKASSPTNAVSFELQRSPSTSNLTKSEVEEQERARSAASASAKPLNPTKEATKPKETTIDVESHPLLANLKVDRNEIGAYMLCKFADDVLGHRARQIFREKASSIKGQNGIYYYLKELMRKFSVDDSVVVATAKKKKVASDELELEEHQFRKLMASDPAFECLVSAADTTMLFQRIVNSSTKTTMTHMDFVAFCLLDRMQLLILLCKYWKWLRKNKLSDNELLDTYRRLTTAGTNGSQMSLEHFGAAISREFDVVLTVGELEVMLDLMDYDGDGVVKPSDFEAFYKDVDRAQKLVELKEPDGIVDLKYSTNDNEAAELKKEGYILYPKNIYEGHGTLLFWYKRAPRESGKPAIEAIQYSASNMDVELVAQGFVCMNGSKPFARKYIWLKHAQARGFQTPELVDIYITSGLCVVLESPRSSVVSVVGNVVDEKSATLWMPPCRGYKQIDGTLDDTNKITARWTTGRRGVFLWTRYKNPTMDVLEFKTPISPTAAVSTTLWARVDDLESQIRTTLRRRCPTEADGVLNFLKLFQSFDKKNRKALSANKLKNGLIALGCKIDAKLYAEVWKRVDVQLKKKIDFDTFHRFVMMTDTEIDDAAETLQRHITQSSSNYRSIFKLHNAAGDGFLSRSDFLRMLASAQVVVSPEELAKIVHRFDVNKDNVVDYADFLKFVTGTCDLSARQAARVADAAADFQAWAIEHQNRKWAKDGNIDSTTSWRLIKSYGDVLRMPMIDKILRQRNWRLNPDEMRNLCILMSPTSPKVGEISRNAYHTFVNHNPKKIATLLVAGRKVVGAVGENGQDAVYNKWNSLGHGKLSLVALHKEFNDVAVEKNIPSMDIKDFVYLVQHSGADCRGDGLVILDRFLACLRDTTERRNMKHAFLTQYDTPQFSKGLQLVMTELKRRAKTLDGKYDYSVPFKALDKEHTQSIRLADFETAVRELGIGQFLSETEIKSLMRRFDVDAMGGIGLDEFCRFLTSDHGGSVVVSSFNHPKLVQAIQEVFVTLPAYGVFSFATMIKRMCSMADKDGTGKVSAAKFNQIFDTLDIALPRPSKKDPPTLTQLLCEYSKSDDVDYGVFCDLYVSCMTKPPTKSAEADAELHKILCDAHAEIQKVVAAAASSPPLERFNFKRALAVIDPIRPSDLKDVLWLARVHYPFSPDEMSILHRAFQTDTERWDVDKFCNFIDRGPSVVVAAKNSDANAKIDAVVAHLQDQIKELVANDKDATRFYKLFQDFDADKDGAISATEFLLVLEQMGLAKGLSAAEKQSILHFFDGNHDNTIDYTEFFHFANHADVLLQAKVDPTKTVAVNASPPKPTAHEPKSAPSSPTKTATTSAPPSPAKSKAVSSPSKEHILTLQNNGKLTALGKQLVRMTELDQLLVKRFPFAKYFEKYKSSHDATISLKKFDLIVEKFLDTVVDAKRTAQVARIDGQMIEKQYVVHETGVVKYPLFLRDFEIAQMLARNAASEAWSDQEDNDEDDDFTLSDSNRSSDSDDDDDDGQSTRQSGSGGGGQLEIVLDRLVQKANWSPSKCTKGQTQLDALSHVTKPKPFMKALQATLKLPWKKSDLMAVAHACRTPRRRIDAAIFIDTMRQVLQRHGGGNSGGNSTSMAGLKPLMGKIYQVFLQAAQRNVNGRQLLERCDTHGGGTIPWTEFSTVLRLIECPLASSELSLLQKTLQSTSSCPIRAFFTLLETYGATSGDASVVQSPRHRASPLGTYYQSGPQPQMQLPPTRIVHPMASAVQFQPPVVGNNAMALDSRVIEQELRSIFVDALRAVNASVVLAAFRKYDVKGCGFISLDGFHSALRAVGIFVSPDVYTKVASRFAARFSDGVDYIEFCHVMGISDGPSMSRSPRATLALPSHIDPPPVNNNDGFLTPRTVESWLQHGATDAERQHFNEMYNSIFEYKAGHSAAKKPRGGVAFPQVSSPRMAQPTKDDNTWSCPVCFHVQSQAKSTCEICAAKNTRSGDFEVVLQCSVCAFRNKKTATNCSLCQTPLKSARSPSRPSQPSSNDGWLT
ncbi:unnamed protein product [Aphanomyces euteiches]